MVSCILPDVSISGIKNGFSWFMSKAVILYPTAVIMAVVLYFFIKNIR